MTCDGAGGFSDGYPGSWNVLGEMVGLGLRVRMAGAVPKINCSEGARVERKMPLNWPRGTRRILSFVLKA